MRIGEYDFVINKFRNKKNITNLVISNLTPCSKREAVKICQWFSEKYYNDKKFIVCLFNKRNKIGKGGYRITNGEKRPTIILPIRRMYNLKKWYGTLRVGLVLHELAHAISAFEDDRYMGHGNVFLKTLDKLISQYYKQYDI